MKTNASQPHHRIEAEALSSHPDFERGPRRAVLILLGTTAAFIVLLPILLNQMPGWFGLSMSTATASHLEFMIFGALIVFFLIVEPHGLARLWSTFKEKLRLWPFPH